MEKIKILDVYFNKSGVARENLELCIGKMKNTINRWNSERLNMLEKITVLRTFALSKLWYQLTFMF